jgi:isocitrate dehydrogenase
MKHHPIAIAKGDGIGPEIMDATLNILKASGAPLDYRFVDIGEKVYLAGHNAGINPETWDTILNTEAFLKAPITTPQGGGFKSLNVTIRTTLGLYANVRPCVAYAPYVKTKHPGMDVVIIRENEEDLYCGIEYRQTQDTTHALKLISRSGSEKIIRYAFEYAVKNGRKKVTCFTKDNILKITDGTFHTLFTEIAKEYPGIENEHWIIDIGAAKLADTPEAFDVIVMPNLYGDILSDVAAQIAGSVGLAGSANIGEFGAMFEAIHGSAPRRANQDLANPSGLILASVLMLNHIGLPHEAEIIHNGWLKTLEEGIHTYDIHSETLSKKKVGTKAFSEAVIDNLGKKPSHLKVVHYQANRKEEKKHPLIIFPKETKTFDGVDIYFDFIGTPDELAQKIERAALPLTLKTIFNRGVAVWPSGMKQTFLIDAWRCRFMGEPKVAECLEKLKKAGLEAVKTENLYSFNGKPGYSLAS